MNVCYAIEKVKMLKEEEDNDFLTNNDTTTDEIDMDYNDNDEFLFANDNEINNEFESLKPTVDDDVDNEDRLKDIELDPSIRLPIALLPPIALPSIKPSTIINQPIMDINKNTQEEEQLKTPSKEVEDQQQQKEESEKRKSGRLKEKQSISYSSFPDYNIEGEEKTLPDKDEQEDESPQNESSSPSLTTIQSASKNKRWSQDEINQYHTILKTINFTFIKKQREIFDFLSSRLNARNHQQCHDLYHSIKKRIVKGTNTDNEKSIYDTIKSFDTNTNPNNVVQNTTELSSSEKKDNTLNYDKESQGETTAITKSNEKPTAKKSVNNKHVLKRTTNQHKHGNWTSYVYYDKLRNLGSYKTREMADAAYELLKTKLASQESYNETKEIDELINYIRTTIRGTPAYQKISKPKKDSYTTPKEKRKSKEIKELQDSVLDYTPKRSTREKPAISYSLLNDDIDFDDDNNISTKRSKENKRFKDDFDYNKVYTPLESTDPLPNLPSTQYCDWSYNTSSRVLLAKFTTEQIHPTDYKFILQMMEKDDISLIIDGLSTKFNKNLYDLQYIDDRIGYDFFHRFRTFKKINVDDHGIEDSRDGKYRMYKEQKGLLAMKIGDYIRYLDQRSTCYTNDTTTKVTTTNNVDDNDSKNNNDSKTDDNTAKDNITTTTTSAQDNNETNKNIANQDNNKINDNINPSNAESSDATATTITVTTAQQKSNHDDTTNKNIDNIINKTQQVQSKVNVINNAADVIDATIIAISKDDTKTSEDDNTTNIQQNIETNETIEASNDDMHNNTSSDVDTTTTTTTNEIHSTQSNTKINENIIASLDVVANDSTIISSQDNPNTIENSITCNDDIPNNNNFTENENNSKNSDETTEINNVSEKEKGNEPNNENISNNEMNNETIKITEISNEITKSNGDGNEIAINKEKYNGIVNNNEMNNEISIENSSEAINDNGIDNVINNGNNNGIIDNDKMNQDISNENKSDSENNNETKNNGVNEKDNENSNDNINELDNDKSNETDEHEFTYFDENNKKKSLNCKDTVIYMIDLDMTKVLPSLFTDVLENFKLPGLLPGGMHCMMNSVNPGGRPFMGPNLYLTPPGSFTHLHQDGHGTVDSGHLCLSGYNEVVILRRMTEERKKHALKILVSGTDNYDALYGLPHGDIQENVPRWPSKEAISKCNEMNYYPSVLILKPGQFLHINKGRLHAFRKLSTEELPPNDCHSTLRAELIKQENITYSQTLCISVAWDWMFKGISSEGINNEVSSIIECTKLNRNHNATTLAIPETCLLQMAKEFPAEHRMQLTPTGSSESKQRESCAPKAINVLKGILPSLRYLVFCHVDAAIQAYDKKQQGAGSDFQRVSIGTKPNAWENPSTFALDPYGNSDFFCKLCGQELSNLYMHCDGCELILNKDFNICVTCHAENRYKIFHQMHPLNHKKHSTINHTGNFQKFNQGRCPCKNGPACKNCGYCSGCSCKCHQWFTLHHRFMHVEDEIKVLKKVESIVGDDIIPLSQETFLRLSSGTDYDLRELEDKLSLAKNRNFDVENRIETGLCQIVPDSSSHEPVNLLPQQNGEFVQNSGGKDMPDLNSTPSSDESAQDKNGGKKLKRAAQAKSRESFALIPEMSEPKRKKKKVGLSSPSVTGTFSAQSNSNEKTVAQKRRNKNIDPDKPLHYTSVSHFYLKDKVVYDKLNAAYPLSVDRKEFWKQLKLQFVALPDDERRKYEVLAANDKKRYEKEMAVYKAKKEGRVSPKDVRNGHTNTVTNEVGNERHISEREITQKDSGKDDNAYKYDTKRKRATSAEMVSYENKASDHASDLTEQNHTHLSTEGIEEFLAEKEKNQTALSITKIQQSITTEGIEKFLAEKEKKLFNNETAECDSKRLAYSSTNHQLENPTPSKTFINAQLNSSYYGQNNMFLPNANEETIIRNAFAAQSQQSIDIHSSICSNPITNNPPLYKDNYDTNNLGFNIDNTEEIYKNSYPEIFSPNEENDIQDINMTCNSIENQAHINGRDNGGQSGIIIGNDDFLQSATNEYYDGHPHPGNYRMKKLINNYRKDNSKVKDYYYVAGNILLVFQVLYPSSRCLIKTTKGLNESWELNPKDKVLTFIINRLKHGCHEEDHNYDQIKIDELNFHPTQNDVFIFRESNEGCCIIASEPYRESINAHREKAINAHREKETKFTATVIIDSAEVIVRGVHSLSPPGRFLERNYGLETEWKEMSEESSIVVTKYFILKYLSSPLNNEAVKASNVEEHIIVPNDNDVIKCIEDHPGTVKYFGLLKFYIEEADEKNFAIIAKKIRNELESMEPPSRMLKKVGEYFEERRDSKYINRDVGALYEKYKKTA